MGRKQYLEGNEDSRESFCKLEKAGTCLIIDRRGPVEREKLPRGKTRKITCLPRHRSGSPIPPVGQGKLENVTPELSYLNDEGISPPGKRSR